MATPASPTPFITILILKYIAMLITSFLMVMTVMLMTIQAEAIMWRRRRRRLYLHQWTHIPRDGPCTTRIKDASASGTEIMATTMNPKTRGGKPGAG